jgi:ATP-dependent exoDNAse (exonuclease V) beta subunit
MKIDTLSKYSFCELDSYMEIISCCCGKLPLSESFSANSRCEDIAVDGLEEESAVPKNEEMAELLKERFSFKYPSPDMAFLPEKMSVSLMSPTVLDGDDDRVRSSIDDFESVDVVNESFESEESSFEFESNDEERAILPAFAGGAVADESAKRGIATHLFMQFCDLEKLGQNGVIAELKRLTDLGFLSEEDAKRVRVREIESFAHSALFEEMRTAKKVHRELRFNLLLPASDFTQIEEKKQAYKNEKILVQGVIDCIVERVDGSLALYDYKTDRLTREEISNRDLGEKKLRDKHSPQLLLYSKAVEKIFGKTPCRVAVYSLVLGDTVLIK